MEQKVKESIYINLGINPYTVVINKRGNSSAICFGQIVDALFIYGTATKAIESLGRSQQTFSRLVKKLFPDITLSGGQTWKQWLIYISDYKLCSSCKTFNLKTEFNKDKSETSGLDHRCRNCSNVKCALDYSNNADYYSNYYKNHRPEMNAHKAKRRAAELRAIPPWADLNKIKEIYKNCPAGYHVDHIFPLQNDISCGLHVDTNLQYLTAKENLSKGNKLPLL